MSDVGQVTKRRKADPREGRPLAVVLVLVLASLAPLPVVAVDNPLNSPEGDTVLGRGFDPSTLYDSDDIDSVNLFNGSLSLAIPIGPSYPQNGGSSLSLRLSYSSNVWDFKAWPASLVDWCDANGQCGPEHAPGGASCLQFAQKWPSRMFNAGLGWRITLGELFMPDRTPFSQQEQAEDGVPLVTGRSARWRYDASDGSSHEFEPLLHQVAGGGPLYTNDGSYLRLQCWDGAAGTDNPECTAGRPILEFPDGSRHYFERDPDHPGAGVDRAFRVQRIEDAFGNGIQVRYLHDGLTWEIVDQHGRTLIVEMVGAGAIGVPGAFGDRFVQRIELPAASTAQGGERRLEYNFRYVPGENPRGCRENYPWGQTSHSPASGGPYVLRAALLSEIELPDGSKYHFDYAAELPPCQPDDLLLQAATLPTGGRVEWDWRLWDMNTAQECPEAFGPRGGGETEFCAIEESLPASATAGVIERRKYDLGSGGGPRVGTWRYEQELNVDPRLDCGLPNLDTLYSTTTVVDALGHKKVHYFSVFTNPDAQSTAPQEGWTRAEYGLPFTRSVARNVGPAGDLEPAFLSTETYQCDDPTTPRLCDGEGEAGCQLLARTYVRYRTDADRLQSVGDTCNRPNTVSFDGCEDLNPLTVEEFTEYYNPFAAGATSPIHGGGSRMSSFDGVGHFRETEQYADFCAHLSSPRRGFCRGDHRVSKTLYNSLLGDLDEGAHPGTFAMPSPEDRWLWTTYEESLVEEHSSVNPGTVDLAQKSTFEFDGDTGFLLRQRTFADTVPPLVADDGRDRLVERTREPRPGGGWTGNLQAERIFGGDGSPLGQGPRFETRHFYDSGVRAASFEVWPPGCYPQAGPLPVPQGAALCERELLLSASSIDGDTGLLLHSEGANGVGVTYDYDGASRLARIDPDGEVETTLSYETAAGQTAASVTMSRGTEARTVVFDGFGRIASDRALRFDGSASKVVKEYFAGGELKRESTRGPAGANPRGVTTYECYDPLGRLLEMRYPDHLAETDIRKSIYRWQGPHLLTTETTGVSRFRGGGSTTVSEFVDQRYDAHGRLWGVIERSAGVGAAGARETLYRRDLGNRITHLRAHDGANATCDIACQDREFLYDGLGDLRAENHPELSGQVEFEEEPWNVVHDRYDARGNPGRRRDGRVELVYDYDYAGRPVRTRRSEAGTLHPVIEFFYAAKNRSTDGSQWLANGSDKTAGRPFQARRHQWLSRSPGGSGSNLRDKVSVTETFRYFGVGGRLSDYGVRSFSEYGESAESYPSLHFTTRLEYNASGRVSRIDYPRCDATVTGHCPPVDPERQVLHHYDHGWLTGVSGPGSTSYAWDIRYHPSGLVHEIVHGGETGVRTVQEEDPEGRQRPHRISTTGIAAGGDWDSGVFRYDTLGNLYQVGDGAVADEFGYDEVNRVVDAQIRSATPGTTLRQSYAFDVFGNLHTLTDESGTSFTLGIDPQTNRLLAPQGYDDSGNLTTAGFLNLHSVEWDAVERPVEVVGTGLNRQFLYTAFGERLATFDNLPSGCGSGCRRDRWTVRGPVAKVLREYTRTAPAGGAPAWQRKDYVYRNGSLLASVEGAETRFFHLDHLGSPRVISDQNGHRSAFHVYFPFGREATSRDQDEERMKFTGHERDFQTELGGAFDDEADDLDYMHARYYSPWIGRFLSVDPLPGSAEAPQSWNRYGYVQGNPVVLLDPTGMSGEAADSAREKARRIWLRRLEIARAGQQLESSEPLSERLRRTGQVTAAAADHFMDGVMDVREKTLVPLLEAVGFHDAPNPAIQRRLDGTRHLPGMSFSTNAGRVSGGAIVGAAASEGAMFGWGFAQGFGPAAIGTMGFTAEASAVGYSTLHVPGMLYGAGAQTGFNFGAASYAIGTQTPIVLGPAGYVTTYVEIPFFLGVSAPIRNVGGLP